MNDHMRPQLVQRIDTVLRAIGTASHDLNDRRGTNNKAARTDAVFEAYVFSLMIEAIRTVPGLSSGPTVQTSTAGKFQFRRAPGRLSTTPSKFSYIEFGVRGQQYELHVDTFVSTKAPGAELEMDVLIVERAAANLCRGPRRRNPRYTETRLAIEVKYLSGQYGTGLAKELLGIWNQVGRRDGHVVLVANCPRTPNAERLLMHRKLRRYVAVIPTSQKGVKKFVDEMGTVLADALR